ncbi:MAG: triose-phosphate isomerase, partial [Bacteroidetes bacterium]|nr:triose-phosphate isomerase [Bacteroidota bacterium]
MRKQIVAGNWKMNNDLSATDALLLNLKKHDIPSDVSVMVAPTFTNLYHAFNIVKDYPIEVIAQNMHQMSHGAFTGEISANMLKSVGVYTVILGHSERRSLFWETNEILAAKVSAALEHEMEVIFCFGEELEDRQRGDHFNVVKEQLTEGLFHIHPSQWKNIVLAY